MQGLCGHAEGQEIFRWAALKVAIKLFLASLVCRFFRKILMCCCFWMHVGLHQCFSIVSAMPPWKENVSHPLFAINKTIIYRNCICIPVPRSHT